MPAPHSFVRVGVTSLHSLESLGESLRGTEHAFGIFRPYGPAWKGAGRMGGGGGRRRTRGGRDRSTSYGTTQPSVAVVAMHEQKNKKSEEKECCPNNKTMAGYSSIYKTFPAEEMTCQTNRTQNSQQTSRELRSSTKFPKVELFTNAGTTASSSGRYTCSCPSSRASFSPATAALNVCEMQTPNRKQNQHGSTRVFRGVGGGGHVPVKHLFRGGLPHRQIWRGRGVCV